MAADKTIFECPVYTLYTQLDGAQRLVIQPSSGASQDFGVPLSLLAQWLFSTYQIGVTGGSGNPDPSTGNNGDLYFQTNGQIKQKTSGGWVIRATMPVPGGQTVTNVIAGTTLVTVTIPHPGVVNPFPFMKDAAGNQYTGATWQDDGTNIIVTAPSIDGVHSADTFDIIIPNAIGSGTGPIGPAGGDLTGAYPNPLINQINGFPASRYNPTSDIQTQLDSKQDALGFTPYNAINPANYITVSAIPTNVSAFSNNENYAKIDGTNTLRTSANFGETASVPDVGHVIDPGAGDNTYSIQCWMHIASQTGSMAVQMELMFTIFGVTWTKTFYIQGSSVGAQSALDFYSFPAMNVRVTSGTTVQVLAIVSGSGTILYECGCAIELKK